MSGEKFFNWICRCQMEKLIKLITVLIIENLRMSQWYTKILPNVCECTYGYYVTTYYKVTWWLHIYIFTLYMSQPLKI